MTDERKERKIVQIAVTPAVLTDREKFHAAVYALADDGSAWVLYSDSSKSWDEESADSWTRIPNLPAPEVTP